MATWSPTVPLKISEDADTVFKSSVSPTSTADGDNLSGAPLVSDLELNDRRHLEGDSHLRVASSALKLDCRGTTVDDLPDELMLEIFSYVSFSENINVLQKVCTRWRILAQDAHLWLHEKYVVRQEMSEEEAIATFSAVPQLRTVILEKEVSPGVFQALSRSCPNLTTLETNLWQMLTCVEADNLFAGCRKIHTLSISDKGVRANVRFLDAVARLVDLRVLHIRETEVADKVIPLHIIADGCPHLSDLGLGDIFGLCYQYQDAEYFISSHKCVLKSLRIRWTSVKGRSIVPLLLVCANVLEHLELINHREISVEEATKTLTALGKLPNLRRLHFGATNREVQHLVPAVFENGRLQKLQHLQLSYMVQDDMVRAVVQHCPDLRELELLRCAGHTDAVFEPLRRLKKLETLKITYCHCLGGKAISYIAKVPALHTLEFNSVKFYKLKPSVDCILEMSELRRLFFKDCICWAIPFDKFPGRLVNLRELEIDYCDGDQDVLDRISAQMPDLRVKGTLGAQITDDSYDEYEYYEEGNSE
ncbi:F-box/LRR-repeat protein 17-like isoform X1 [Schistocerca gregaria]|uniref:F-box/LRR-repeat protein 17-like isoform X1 n=1 Tax=Schistocerca gregaria TaxID=7010 RepID=UPI00211E0091|nr:F-box/LRR-repeat protein 17-like isoform X1 [Schistocerca gregaria]